MKNLSMPKMQQLANDFLNEVAVPSKNNTVDGMNLVIELLINFCQFIVDDQNQKPLDWTDYFEGLNPTPTDKKEVVERPNVVHNHTPGDWYYKSDGHRQMVIYDSKGNNILTNDVPFDQQDANGKLMKESPKLLQIAEMFFDSLKGKEGTMVHNLVLETLNSIK